MDESYIKELLAHAAKRKPKDDAAFLALFKLDIDQGYRAEVLEACKRYFNRKK